MVSVTSLWVNLWPTGGQRAVPWGHRRKVGDNPVDLANPLDPPLSVSESAPYRSGTEAAREAEHDPRSAWETGSADRLPTTAVEDELHRSLRRKALGSTCGAGPAGPGVTLGRWDGQRCAPALSLPGKKDIARQSFGSDGRWKWSERGYRHATIARWIPSDWWPWAAAWLRLVRRPGSLPVLVTARRGGERGGRRRAPRDDTRVRWRG